MKQIGRIILKTIADKRKILINHIFILFVIYISLLFTYNHIVTDCACATSLGPKILNNSIITSLVEAGKPPVREARN